MQHSADFHGQKGNFPDDLLFPQVRVQGLLPADTKFHLPGSFPGGICHHLFLGSPDSLSLEGNGLMEDIQKLMEEIQEPGKHPMGWNLGTWGAQQFQVRASGAPLEREFGAGGSPQPWETNSGKLVALSSQGFEGPPC